MAIEKLTVPDLGDATEVEVIELLVAVGDSVEKDDSLLVLESDKAAMEIPAPMAGVVKSIEVNLGDNVSEGGPMLTLETDAESSEESAASGEGAASEGSAASEEKDASESTAESEKESDQAADKKEKAKEEPKEEQQAAAEPSDSGAGESETITVPDLGTDDEVDVIEIHVKAGDSVAEEDPLITLESDKAAMEVPAPKAGLIDELLIKVGDKVKTGADILRLTGSAGSSAKPEAEDKEQSKDTGGKSGQESDQKVNKAETAKEPPAAKDSKPAAPPSQPAQSGETASANAAGSAKVYAGPAVRKLARELGVDLTQVKASGAKSRILKEDIHDFVKSRINAPASQGPAVSQVPDIDFSQFGEIEQVQRSKMAKLTATNMQRNWNAVPHVAQFIDADVTDLEDFRAELRDEAEKRGTKLTFLPFLLKACARALGEYPQFNVSLHSSGEYLIQKKYCHIGMAVATEAGLLVPVIRDVDKKSIWELSEEVLSLSKKAKERKLTPSEMQGACFSISSLGAIGGSGFIPIVNAPEVAILGVSKTDIKPVYIDGEFKPRKMLPLTLSYDHKAVNGVDGGLFATYLAKLLGDIRHLAL